MKLLLLIGGIAFLLLGVLLCIAAIVVFLMAKKRAGKQPSAAAQKPASPPSPPPVATASAPPPVPGSDVPTTPPWDAPLAPPPLPAGEAPRAASWEPPPAVPPPPPPAVPAADPFAGDSTLALPLPGREQWGSLMATTGALAGQSFPVTADGFYIGRDSSLSQIVIADGSVSKRHVWVGVRDGEVVAIDEGSTNGTYLNSVGARIQRQTLNPGDTLIISNDIARLVYQR